MCKYDDRVYVIVKLFILKDKNYKSLGMILIELKEFVFI